MKITALETIRVAERPNLIWLQVHTDQGLVGLGETFFSQSGGDRCGESGLAMVNVSDGSDVNVGFGSGECFLGHGGLLGGW